MLLFIGSTYFFILLVNCRPFIEKNINHHKDDSFPIAMGNKEETEGEDDLVEFDMKFSKHREKRAVTQVSYWKWIDGIVPYVFDTILPINDAKKNLTLEAFRHIEEFTCVRFIPRTNEIDFINITTLSGCWSYVGRAGGMQEYSLGNNCEDFGVIVHESLHALGFYHEHNRPDRDQHIIINLTNVEPGSESAFERFNLTHPNDKSLQNISYDIQSIMHYERYTFTKHIDEFGYLIEGQGSMTMYAIGDHEQILGSSIGLSYKDKLRVNKYYGCNITILQATTTSASSTSSVATVTNTATTTSASGTSSVATVTNTATTTSASSTIASTVTAGNTTTTSTTATNVSSTDASVSTGPYNSTTVNTSTQSSQSTSEISTTSNPSSTAAISTTSASTEGSQTTQNLEDTSSTVRITTTDDVGISTTNGSLWGIPKNHANQQQNSFLMMLSLVTLAFIKLL